VRLRGWPAHLDTTVALELVTETGDATEPFTLRITEGHGELEPSNRPGRMTLTRGQFAAWYAGGYRTATAAVLDGVRGDPVEIARLVGVTTEREPWLAEYF